MNITNITSLCLIVLKSVCMAAGLFLGAISDSLILLWMVEHSDQWGRVTQSVSLFSPPVS